LLSSGGGAIPDVSNRNTLLEPQCSPETSIGYIATTSLATSMVVHSHQVENAASQNQPGMDWELGSS
jgi:hypothetical protein